MALSEMTLHEDPEYLSSAVFRASGFGFKV